MWININWAKFDLSQCFQQFFGATLPYREIVLQGCCKVVVVVVQVLHIMLAGCVRPCSLL